jgi:predicted molibdopterin-dependent oxidoreductase YjgC
VVDGLPGFEQWRRSLDHCTAEAAQRATGLDSRRIDALAEATAAARRPVLVVATASGVPGDEAATARAAAMLAALLGPTAGLMVLGSRSNTQGLVDVGLHPRMLPGHRRLDRADELAALTGRATVSHPGWTVAEWMAADPGSVSGLLLVGVDPIDLLPGRERPRRAIEGAGFTVAIDAFLSHSAELADVVLPTAILSERSGTTVSGDGVRRPLRRALEPPGGVRADGEILSEIALRMGGRLPTAGEVLDEIDRVVGWSWSRPVAVGLPSAPPPRPLVQPSGFFLDAAPQLFHSGSTTTRSALLQELSPTIAARLNPVDAAAIGVARGEVVEVSGRRGELLLRARLDRTTSRGTVGVSWVGDRHGASTLFDTTDDVLSVKVRKV